MTAIEMSHAVDQCRHIMPFRRHTCSTRPIRSGRFIHLTYLFILLTREPWTKHGRRYEYWRSDEVAMNGSCKATIGARDPMSYH